MITSTEEARVFQHCDEAVVAANTQCSWLLFIFILFILAQRVMESAVGTSSGTQHHALL